MKVLKFIVELIWTLSLQNLFLYMKMLWIWFWSLTNVDEKAIAIAKEVKGRAEEAAYEMGDVVDALAGKEIKSKKRSKKTKSKK
jgi:hypothetical protein